MEGLKYILILSLLRPFVYAEYPVVNTTTGEINGSTILVLDVDIDVFHGIPFAKPPVGNLRFKRPEPIERWSGVKETKEHVATCEQYIDEMTEELGGELWKTKTNVSEDCLYLNIWAPTEARMNHSNLTTMIWIYGGGFTSGSSALKMYDGRWLAANQNVIVASLNYRLGLFGFLSLNDERAPGNMGLLDQNLAIKWIHDNIVLFGGDPDKLTLFGESAGAASVSMHVISPMSRDLFKNAIIMSGLFNADWAIKRKEENIESAKKIAAILKCPTENDKQMLDCFLKADAKNITLGQASVRSKFFGIPFTPIIDDYFLQEKSIKDLQNKAIKKDVLIGFVKNEGSIFLFSGFPKYFFPNENVPINNSIAHELMNEVTTSVQLNPKQLDAIFYVYGSNIYSSSETEKYTYVLDQVVGDMRFKCPTFNFSREWSTHSNVYMYSFNYRSKYTFWPEWMGTTHGSEISYVFLQTIYGENSTSEDKTMSKMMSSYFANFSKSSNPNNGDCANCPDEPWWKFTRQNQKYFVIDMNQKMENKDTSMYSVCSFWSDFVPQLKERTCPEPKPSGSQNIWTFQGRILTTFSSIIFSLMLFWNVLC